MAENVPNDPDMRRIEFGDGCRCNMPKCMRPHSMAQVFSRDISQRARKAIVRKALSILIDPKPCPIVLAQEQRSVLVQIFSHLRHQLFWERVIVSSRMIT
nr:hypothetical protein [Sediminimonas sp.]